MAFLCGDKSSMLLSLSFRAVHESASADCCFRLPIFLARVMHHFGSGLARLHAMCDALSMCLCSVQPSAASGEAAKCHDHDHCCLLTAERAHRQRSGGLVCGHVLERRRSTWRLLQPSSASVVAVGSLSAVPTFAPRSLPARLPFEPDYTKIEPSIWKRRTER